MAIVGMNSRSDLKFQQNSAYGPLGFVDFFAALCTSCQRLKTHRWTPRPIVYCLVRDPHSCRSVPVKGRPVSFNDLCAEKCRSTLIALVVTSYKVDLSAIEIRKKGTKTCLRKLGLSRQQQLSVWLGAWKQTFSAVLLVAQSVRLRPLNSVLTRPQVQQLVLQQHCCVTTQVSAAHHVKTFRAIAACFTDMNSRRGFASAAVLRSKDPLHV